jgi:hypothetical protein
MYLKFLEKIKKMKYDINIITKTPDNLAHPDKRTILFVNDELNGALKDAYYLDCGFVLRPDKDPSPQAKPHNHNYDEYLIFLGTDPDNPSNLGGEIELWLDENEKHILKNSCAVFVPKGLYHTPLIFSKVEKPIICIRTGQTLKDVQLSYSKDPKWAHLPNKPVINK